MMIKTAVDVQQFLFRKDLVKELVDVLMYYNDVLLCFDISLEESRHAYIEKFQRNMNRW